MDSLSPWAATSRSPTRTPSQRFAGSHLSPGLQLVRRLHRNGRGLIQFLRLKEEGDLVPGWPRMVQAALLDDPNFDSSVFQAPDTFFTVNGLRAGSPDATAENVGHLNALWVDCDCHDLHRAEQEAQLEALENSRLLPPASAVAWSGRGVWLLWLLQGHTDLSLPPAANEGRRELHQEIEREIARTLQGEFPELRADGRSTNPNRLTRIPGTVNSKSGTAVRWDVRDWGQLYRLEDWPRTGAGRRRSRATKAGARPAQAAGTSFPSEPAANTKPWDGRIPVAKNPQGAMMRWQWDLNEFDRLRKLRGGFREGTRSSVAWLYAYMLRQSWTEEEEILASVERLAAECKPPLSDPEWRAAIKSSGSVWRPLTRLHIVTMLEVRPDEAEHLERWHDPETHRKLAEEAEKKERRQRHSPEERHEAMRNMVKKLGGEIPTRRTAHKLLQEDGVWVSKNTVAKDYRTLGFS